MKPVLNPSILCVITVFFPGCSVLKNRSVNKADSSFVQREQLATSVSLKERTDSEIRLLYTDSGKHTYLVEISPEGEFSYSPLSGFSGKAKVLKISGNGEVWQQGLAAVSVHNSVKIDSTGYKETKKQVVVSDTRAAVRIKKDRKSDVWILIGLAVAVIIWLFIRGRMHP